MKPNKFNERKIPTWILSIYQIIRNSQNKLITFKHLILWKLLVNKKKTFPKWTEFMFHTFTKRKTTYAWIELRVTPLDVLYVVWNLASMRVTETSHFTHSIAHHILLASNALSKVTRQVILRSVNVWLCFIAVIFVACNDEN